MYTRTKTYVPAYIWIKRRGHSRPALVLLLFLLKLFLVIQFFFLFLLKI